jgi:hypothetical protein
MPQVGFEPTIPVFERAKTVHAWDRVGIVTGKTSIYTDIANNQLQKGNAYINTLKYVQFSLNYFQSCNI